MTDKSKGKELQEKLLHKWDNVWDKIDDSERGKIFSFGDEYKTFLDTSKTERESATEIIRVAKENGYIELEEVIDKKMEVKAGMKIYANNKGKGVAMFVIGEEDLKRGMNIIGSHMDSPRIDLKQFPLYEDGELALLKTHYYGGIKKYHWVSLPLAIHGTIIKENGEKLNIVIGEDESDPVFFITDLLIHLAKDQMAKKLSEGITGEGLNIVIGSIPYEDEEISDRIKLNVLKLLHDKYGIVEKDFTTAELEVVPAGKARDVGIDRSLVAAHGHDDRACVFTSLEAILEIENPKRTAVALFVDKEEIGSVGNTGMESNFFENTVSELIELTGETYSEIEFKRAMANSKVLSADVTTAFDPNYPDVLDKRNAAFIGKGVTIMKYSGVRGKAGSSDANAEYLAEIRRIFDENDIVWQMGELGKVDQGGGGTIAYILARYGMEVVDCGISVLSVHSPYELASKADIYMVYKGYKAFYNA